jgi:hypothetical protein
MQARVVVIGLLTASLSIACSSASEEPLGEAKATVLNGDKSGPEEDFVVRVNSQTTLGAMYNCSGALVAPNLVVTSRQCLVNVASNGGYTCDAAGGIVGADSTTLALVDPARISIRAGVGPASPEVAKGATIFSLTEATPCRNDFAAVLLDRSLPELPIAPIRLHSGVARGERIRAIGYGLDFEGLGGQLGVRHGRSDLPVAKVGSSTFLPDGGGTPPQTFTVEGPVMCFGDSGAPALSANGAVVGTLSGISDTCSSATAINTFTQVASFASDVLLPAFAAAGYEPVLESNPVTADAGIGGAGGTGGAGDTLNSTGGGDFCDTANAGSGPTSSVPIEANPANATARAVGGCHTAAGSPVGRHWIFLLCALLIGRNKRRS